MTEKKFKQICECTKCGNEAEMTVTCNLVEDVAEKAAPQVVPEGKGKAEGHAVCSHCGGEADIWVDF